MQLVKVLYCKLQTNGTQLPAFPLEAGPRTEPQPQRWESSATVPPILFKVMLSHKYFDIFVMCVLLYTGRNAISILEIRIFNKLEVNY